jgi:hypothetical protein
MAAMGGAGSGIGATATHKVVGEGSYGIVIKPSITGNRTKVTKIFNKYRDFNSAKYAMDTKLPPSMKYKMIEYQGGIPNLTKLLSPENYSRLERRYITPSSTYVNMPDFGIDFEQAIKPENIELLRKIPSSTYANQIIKLLQQTYELAARGIGHFDIRDVNITIQPSTGVITIIDFDQVSEYDGARFNLSYNKPIELLIFEDIFSTISIEEIITKSNTSYGFKQYVHDHCAKLQPLFSKLGWMKETDTCVEKITEIINTANIENIKYFRAQYESGIRKDQLYYNVLQSCDNVCLGFILLHFLFTLYPGELPIEINRLIPLLLQISSYEFSKRPNPNDAVEIARGILTQIQKEAVNRAVAAAAEKQAANRAAALFQAAIYIDNDATQIANVQRFCPDAGRIHIIKAQEGELKTITKDSLASNPDFIRYINRLGENNLYTIAVKTLLHSVKGINIQWDPNSGIGDKEITEMYGWLDATKHIAKRVAILDWDRTLTKFEGQFDADKLGAFAKNIPIFKAECKKRFHGAYALGRCSAPMISEGLVILFGGYERLEKIKQFIKTCIEQKVQLRILLNNASYFRYFTRFIDGIIRNTYPDPGEYVPQFIDMSTYGNNVGVALASQPFFDTLCPRPKTIGGGAQKKRTRRRVPRSKSKTYRKN